MSDDGPHPLRRDPGVPERGVTWVGLSVAIAGLVLVVVMLAVLAAGK